MVRRSRSCGGPVSTKAEAGMVTILEKCKGSFLDF